MTGPTYDLCLLSQHWSDVRGSLEASELEAELAREQLMVDRMGGIKKLLNVVNPIGARRFSLMPNQPYVR